MAGLKKGESDASPLRPVALDYEPPRKRERWPWELFVSWCFSSFIVFAGLALWMSVAVAAAGAAVRAGAIFPLVIAVVYTGLGLLCVFQGITIVRDYPRLSRSAAVAGFSLSGVLWATILWSIWDP